MTTKDSENRKKHFGRLCF